MLNKIDLPAAQPERYAQELAAIIGCDPSEVLRVSAKTGDGVEELLNAIVDQVPPPHGDPDAPARALIFDSVYDTYRGVVTYVRVVDGKLTKRERMLMMSTQSRPRDPGARRHLARSRSRPTASARARSATSSPA